MRGLPPSVQARAGQRGTIVLFVLFVTVAIVVLVQALSVVIISAERARSAENMGRDLFGEKERALLDTRDGLLAEWGTHEWSSAADGELGVSTLVEAISGAGDWALDASAAHPAATSPIVLSVWVERGRDGLDLPIAGLVGETATWSGGRETPCVEMDSTEEPSSTEGETVPTNRPVAWLVEQPGELPTGSGLEGRALARPWRLDDGWNGVFDSGGQGEVPSGLSLGPSVIVLSGGKGATVSWPAGLAGEADAPVLVVVTGGADLEAVGRGDVHAVVVCDGGGVSLEGTRVHGGVFASGNVDFGVAGAVLFAQDTVRWAADRSLVRARLVPGSRREVVE